MVVHQVTSGMREVVDLPPAAVVLGNKAQGEEMNGGARALTSTTSWSVRSLRRLLSIISVSSKADVRSSDRMKASVGPL